MDPGFIPRIAGPIHNMQLSFRRALYIQSLDATALAEEAELHALAKACELSRVYIFRVLEMLLGWCMILLPFEVEFFFFPNSANIKHAKLF